MAKNGTATQKCLAFIFRSAFVLVPLSIANASPPERAQEIPPTAEICEINIVGNGYAKPNPHLHKDGSYSLGYRCDTGRGTLVRNPKISSNIQDGVADLYFIRHFINENFAIQSIQNAPPIYTVFMRRNHNGGLPSYSPSQEMPHPSSSRQ